METLPHGSSLERRDGLPARIRDRHGRLALEASWRGRRLERAELTLPDGRPLVLAPAAGEQPLFGPSDALVLGGEVLAWARALDWAEPETIPPLDRPGALPSGAGTAVLNLLALSAGERPLRYRGPYPTAPLFDSLLDCFRVAGEPEGALSRFLEGAEESALTGRFREPPVDFEPAPFERLWCGGEVCAQLRDGLEKVWVRGRSYARRGGGARRLEHRGEGWAAVLVIGGEVWAEVARFDRRGELASGPHPVPPAEHPLVGEPLPAKVKDLLGALLPRRAPALLGGELGRLLAEVEIRWGDPGEAAAARAGDAIVVHAALADRLEAEALLEALARAVEPVAQRWAQERLAARL